MGRPGVAQKAAQGHGQHAGAWLQGAAGPRATALDEVLGGEAAAEQAVQILVEHRGIEGIALEAAPHEEGTAASQDVAHHRHVQVDAGGDVRRGQAVLEQQVGEQQVVDVAAVAGDVDHGMTGRHLLDPLDVADRDAIVDAVPEPAQTDVQAAHHRIGEVRGDLPRIVRRLVFDASGSGLALGDLVGDGRPHLGCPQQTAQQGAPVRQVRTDHRLAHVAEVDAQPAHHQTLQALRIGALAGQFAQGQWLGELHPGQPAQHQDARQLAQPAGHHPVVRPEQFPGTGLAIRRLTPEDADRHQLDVFQLLLGYRGDHPAQGGGHRAPRRAPAPVGLAGGVEVGQWLGLAAQHQRA